MKEITERADLELLVDTFYGKVLQDPLLIPFFDGMDFEKHKPDMVSFWSFVLLSEPGYKTNVTEKHLHMDLYQQHFDRWIALFHETVDELFSGEIAEMAKQRASQLGWTIHHKIAGNREK
jgi:hemoglobin